MTAVLADSRPTALLALRAPKTTVRTPTTHLAVRALLHAVLAWPLCWRGSLPLGALLRQLFFPLLVSIGTVDVRNCNPHAWPLQATVSVPPRRLLRECMQRDRVARRQRLVHRGRTRREPAVFGLEHEPSQDLVGVDDQHRRHDVEVRLTFECPWGDVVEGDKTAGVVKRRGQRSRRDRW